MKTIDSKFSTLGMFWRTEDEKILDMKQEEFSEGEPLLITFQRFASGNLFFLTNMSNVSHVWFKLGMPYLSGIDLTPGIVVFWGIKRLKTLSGASQFRLPQSR